ncbi:MAG: hypothetical protein K2N64_02460, partial [Anaeroplasmataceae bacterium]|nr:hypothetical protein [Anaeroplasmataceae bacterium]
MRKIAILFLLIIFLFTTSCSQKEQKETYTFYAMDTFISITFYNTENSEELARGVEDIYIN